MVVVRTINGHFFNCVFLYIEIETALTVQLLLQQVPMVTPLRRTYMTADMRTLVRTQHRPRLQYLPLQVPQLPRDHPGETAVTEMIATGMAIAVVRILHQFHWHICIERSTGMHFLAFFHYFIHFSGNPGLSGPKIALDACCPNGNQTII